MIDPAAVENREQPTHEPLRFAQLFEPGETARQGFLGKVVGQGRIVAPGEGQAIEPAAARFDLPRQFALHPRLQPLHRLFLQFHCDAAAGRIIPWRNRNISAACFVLFMPPDGGKTTTRTGESP